MSSSYYQLSVISHDVACEVRVNDVPVLRIPSGRVETSFDVNPYVVSGENTLSLRIHKVEGSEDLGQLSACSVRLGVKSSSSVEELSAISSLSFELPEGVPSGFENSPGFVEGAPPRIGVKGFEATQSFALDTPLAPWFWLDADELRATEAVRTDVLKEYQRIHDMLVSRDVDALCDACREQAGDWQIAYGTPDLRTAQRMLGIAQTLGDSDLDVGEFPEAALTMELLGGGRLVQLVDAAGKSPLRLGLKSSKDLVGRFNVVLCRVGSRWVIAR